MKKYILYSLCCALLSASMFGAQIKKKPVIKKTTVTPKKKAAEAAKAKIQPKTGTKATKPAAKKDKPKAGPGAGVPVPPPVPAWSQAGAGAPPLPPIPTDAFTNFLSIIAAGDVRSAQQLLQDNPEFALLADKKTGDTALIIAARAGNREIIRLLIQSGADLNQKNNQNMDAIDVARPEIRDALISASGIMPPSAEPTHYAGPGAPPAARPERKREVAQTPPPIPAWEPTGAGAGTPPPIPAWEPEPTKTAGPSAARTKKPKAVAQEEPSESDLKKFIAAIRGKDFKTLQQLVEQNSTILKAKNEFRLTGLIEAVHYNDPEMVQYLLQQINIYFPDEIEAIVQEESTFGDSALSKAQEYDPEIAKLRPDIENKRKAILHMLENPSNPEFPKKEEGFRDLAQTAARGMAYPAGGARVIESEEGAGPISPRLEGTGAAAGAGAGANAPEPKKTAQQLLAEWEPEEGWRLPGGERLPARPETPPFQVSWEKEESNYREEIKKRIIPFIQDLTNSKRTLETNMNMILDNMVSSTKLLSMGLPKSLKRKYVEKLDALSLLEDRFKDYKLEANTIKEEIELLIYDSKYGAEVIEDPEKHHVKKESDLNTIANRIENNKTKINNALQALIKIRNATDELIKTIGADVYNLTKKIISHIKYQLQQAEKKVQTHVEKNLDLALDALQKRRIFEDIDSTSFAKKKAKNEVARAKSALESLDSLIRVKSSIISTLTKTLKTYPEKEDVRMFFDYLEDIENQLFELDNNQNQITDKKNDFDLYVKAAKDALG